MHIENAKGFWGGVPFQGTVSFVGGDHGRVDVDLALALPRREGRLRPNSEAWCRAQFRADLEKLGDFQAEELTGVVQAIGDRVELRHGAAKLRPRGDLSGIVDLDLSRADAVPYHARIELVNGSLSELMSDLKMDGGAANGTADIDTELDGLLIAHHNLLADSNGPADAAAAQRRDPEAHERALLDRAGERHAEPVPLARDDPLRHASTRRSRSATASRARMGSRSRATRCGWSAPAA